MKEYVCVQVGHHNDVSSSIEEFQKNGWRLPTYQVTGRDIGLHIIRSLNAASEWDELTLDIILVVFLIGFLFYAKLHDKLLVFLGAVSCFSPVSSLNTYLSTRVVYCQGLRCCTVVL